MSKKQPATPPAAAPAEPPISFAPRGERFEGPVTFPPGAGAYIRTASGEVIPDPSETPPAPAEAAPQPAPQKEADE